MTRVQRSFRTRVSVVVALVFLTSCGGSDDNDLSGRWVATLSDSPLGSDYRFGGEFAGRWVGGSARGSLPPLDTMDQVLDFCSDFPDIVEDAMSSASTSDWNEDMTFGCADHLWWRLHEKFGAANTDSQAEPLQQPAAVPTPQRQPSASASPSRVVPPPTGAAKSCKPKAKAGRTMKLRF